MEGQWLVSTAQIPVDQGQFEVKDGSEERILEVRKIEQLEA
jgi:hypothetical protein